MRCCIFEPNLSFWQQIIIILFTSALPIWFFNCRDHHARRDYPEVLCGSLFFIWFYYVIMWGFFFDYLISLMCKDGNPFLCANNYTEINKNSLHVSLVMLGIITALQLVDSVRLNKMEINGFMKERKRKKMVQQKKDELNRRESVKLLGKMLGPEAQAKEVTQRMKEQKKRKKINRRYSIQMIQNMFGKKERQKEVEKRMNPRRSSIGGMVFYKQEKLRIEIEEDIKQARNWSTIPLEPIYKKIDEITDQKIQNKFYIQLDKIKTTRDVKTKIYMSRRGSAPVGY